MNPANEFSITILPMYIKKVVCRRGKLLCTGYGRRLLNYYKYKLFLFKMHFSIRFLTFY